MFNTWNVGSSGAPEMWWPEMSNLLRLWRTWVCRYENTRNHEKYDEISKKNITYDNITSTFDYLCIYLQILNLTCPMYFHQMTGFACQATKMARRRVTPCKRQGVRSAAATLCHTVSTHLWSAVRNDYPVQFCPSSAENEWRWWDQDSMAKGAKMT